MLEERLKEEKYVQAICFCGKCEKAFSAEIDCELLEFVNKLSYRGCPLCEVESGEKPEVCILKFVSEDEINAQSLIESGLTHYCEFENEIEIEEPITDLQEFYNSLCKFTTF